MVKYINVLISK